jgi:hypothetical protein
LAGVVTIAWRRSGWVVATHGVVLATAIVPRRLVALVLITLLVGAACGRAGQDAAQSTGGTGTGAEPPSDLVELACSLPHQWLLRTWRGDMEDRSAELQILPFEPNFVGAGLPHVGPWAYAQDIPMFWYGPGHVAAQGEVDRPVTLAGIAPTQAELLDFAFRAPDGSAMREAIEGNPSPP